MIPGIARHGHGRPELRLLAFLLALLSSCTGEGRNPPTLQVDFDTVGGIPVVANRGKPPAWPVENVLSLGGLDATEEAQQFGRVTSVVADEDGNLFVLDRVRGEVLMFSPAGQYLRTIGRHGPGPGEYGNPNYLGMLGDTLVVSDGTGQRVELFEPNGDWIGEWRNIRSPWGIFQAGTRQLWVGTYEWDGSSDPVRVFEGRGLDGSVDTVKTLPDPDRDLMEPKNVVACRSPAWVTGFSVPFAPRVVRMPTPNSQIIESDPVGYRMVFTSLQGDTARIVEYFTPDVGVSDLDWSEQEEGWREFRSEYPGGSCDGRLHRPTRKRLMGDILFDNEGRIWVKRIQLNSSQREHFDVFGPAGDLLGEVALPMRIQSGRPFIRDSLMYLVTADTLQVQTVRVFRFSRPDRENESAGSR